MRLPILATLVPSANLVVERTTIALLRDVPVEPVFTRIPKRGATDPFPDSHDTGSLLAAADLLADAGPAAIVVSASKGAAIGLGHDRALVAAIRARTGIAADTPGLALLRAARALGITRIALIGPHAAEYNHRAARGFAAEGIETLAQAALGITDNLAFASVGQDAILGMARAVAQVPGVQAVVAWNTNCDAAPLAEGIEAECGVTFLDATALGVRGGLQVAGVPARPGPGWGRLFAMEV
jgi:maleate isomerase